MRLFLSIFALLFLSNCSHVHLFQHPEAMLVRVGTTDEPVPAAPYAHNFVAYALLSDQTYADSVYKTKRFDLGPQTYCYEPPDGGGCIDYTPYARKILSEWRLVWASMDTKDFQCRPARALCTEPLPGLGVQIWVRRGAVCGEAVVAFRGTDGSTADDWLSNFRFLLRALPLYDQYEQVQDHTPNLLRKIARDRCFVPGRTKIIAVGHSLGGGLAQQASYMDRSIQRVFAFDPSFITGSHDVPPVYDQNVRGLAIERIYEHGEILAYPRFLLRHVLPAAACNPQIRMIRFNALRGFGISQHKLKRMTNALLNWSYRTPPSERITRLPAPKPKDCPAQPTTIKIAKARY